MPENNVGGIAAGGDEARLEHIAIIRTLNDKARAAMRFRSIYVTVGIRAMGALAASQAVATVRAVDAFDAGNDPYGEHDFGAFQIGGQRAFWKIDYYDRELQGGAPDPADDRVTSRVLTIMLAEEY